MGGLSVMKRSGSWSLRPGCGQGWSPGALSPGRVDSRPLCVLTWPSLCVAVSPSLLIRTEPYRIKATLATRFYLNCLWKDVSKYGGSQRSWRVGLHRVSLGAPAQLCRRGAQLVALCCSSHRKLTQDSSGLMGQFPETVGDTGGLSRVVFSAGHCPSAPFRVLFMVAVTEACPGSRGGDRDSPRNLQCPWAPKVDGWVGRRKGWR